MDETGLSAHLKGRKPLMRHLEKLLKHSEEVFESRAYPQPPNPQAQIPSWLQNSSWPLNDLLRSSLGSTKASQKSWQLCRGRDQGTQKGCPAFPGMQDRERLSRHRGSQRR